MKPHLWLVLICAVALASCDVEQDNPISSPSEYYDQGVRFFDEGSYRQAEASFVNAIALIGKNTEFINSAELYAYLGRTNLELGEYRSAIDHLENAIQRSAQLNDYRLQARITGWKADAYLEMRNYADAAEEYRKSMRLSSALDDATTRAATGIHMGSALVAEGHLDQASNAFNESLGVFQSARQANGIAEALGGIGDIYRREGRYSEALNTLNQATETLGSGGDPLLQAKLKIVTGLVQNAQANANGAIIEFRDAVNILRRRQVSRNYEALSLFLLGSVYEDNGRFADAKKYYSDALDIDKAVGDRISEDYLYYFIVRCNLRLMTDEQRSQASERLLQSYQQIASKFHECGHRTGEAYLYTLIGSLYESRGDFVNARAMYQKAVDLDLEMRGEYFDADLHLPLMSELGIAGNHTQWYTMLAAVLLKMNLNDEAVAVLDLGQVRSSMDTFEHLEVTLRHPQLKDLVKDCRSKLNTIEMLEMELTNMLSGRQQTADPKAITSIQSQLTDLRKKVNDQTGRIIAVQPNYELFLAAQQKNAQDFRSSIPGGTVVLTFLPAADELYLLAVTREGIEVHTVAIGRDSLLSLVQEYERLLQDPQVYAGAGGEASLPSMARFEKLSTQLYEYFIRPIEPRFERNLAIVAGNDFRDFPFHALERQDKKANVKYLIELTSVDYLPMLSALRYKTASTPDINNVIAFGNPNGQNWSVDYELRDIRSFFKGATVLLGTDATWKNLLQLQGDVLQLSTDFLNRPGGYDLGEFVCSNGKTQGETEDIAFEHLTDQQPYPVIELSNQQSKGAGLSPLHALLLRMNGTSDIFLNAWIADRKAAKFFSEYFYTNLANGLAPGDAYRQALLNLIGTREVSHPRSWGQFFHFGLG
ncbi:MAG TPA: tetratricopeptide repeat protein [Bacteroidota bacterium]